MNTTFLIFGGEGGMSFLFIGLMFIIMYFFMIRPQMQRQKREKSFQESMKVGERIVTTSGIHGRISEVTDDVVTVETNAGKIRFEKTAISQELTKVRYGDELAVKK